MRRSMATFLLVGMIIWGSPLDFAGVWGSGNASGTTLPDGNPLETLIRARSNVEAMFEQSDNVVCLESVTQAIVGRNEHTVYREESKYEYQLQTAFVKGALKLSEAREPSKLAFRDPSRTLLITSGFAAMLLVVHPNYESSYQIEGAGEEVTDTGTLVKLHFTPVAGASSPAALRLRGKNYPLPLSGTVWIDKSTGAIVRLTASVDSSLSDLGLKGMTSDIHYALIQFHNPDESYWMPVSATIDLETPKQHWRNIHRFTAYRRFTGTVRVEPAPKL
jgi:hypothetical protein